MTTEEVPAIHARHPLVTNLHKTVPVIPPGWVEVILRKVSGVTKVAYKASAIARFTSK